MNTSLLYPLIFDAIREPLLLVDESGVIQLANSAANDFFSVDATRTVSGLSCRDAHSQLDASELVDLIQAGEPVAGYRLPSVRGERGSVIVDLDSVPGGDANYWLLRVRPDEAGTAGDFWKDEMISLVSHEIKNPLSAMKHSVDLLLSQAPGELTDGQRRFLNTSGRSIDRLVHIVDGFLDVSRIRAGAFEVTRGPVDVHNFINDAMHSFQTLFNVTRTSIEWVVDTDTTDAHIDASKLEQVLLNLLSNALKFTPENGEIRVVAKSVGIETLDDRLRLLPWNEIGRPRILEIAVHDTGIGMTSETIESVYDRFHGPAGTPTPAPRGVHLGLNISRTLAEAQGGWLDIESRLGIGTTVTVRVPQDRRTLTALNRLGQMDRLLRKCIEARRPVVVYALGKFSDDDWDDVSASWQENAVINSTGENTRGAFHVWTLTNELAVAIHMEPGEYEVDQVFATNFVVCEDNAFVFPSYSVGAADAPAEARATAQLLGIAIARMTRARDLMARATIEAMDSGIEYITDDLHVDK